MRPAVFLDRDDTLIECRSVTPTGDLGDPALVALKPGVARGVAALKQAGYALVVVSNQGGVARGAYRLDDAHRVNARVDELLGGVVDAFRICPYHPAGAVPEFTREHPWRKPAPGMILDAAEALSVDLARSWMVGDAERDCRAGRAAGCRTVWIADPPPDPADAADVVAADFTAAVRAILSTDGSPQGAGALPAAARRVLVVAPSWVGDAVMATPALGALRQRLPGALVGVLAKPGLDAVYEGSGLFDEIHIDSRAGMMGVKRAAAKVRPIRYDTALLLANSLSTALLARLAGIPRRVGDGRDGRSLLLTDSMRAPTRADTPPFDRERSGRSRYAPRSACDHYMALVRVLLNDPLIEPGPLKLGLTEAQREAGDALLDRAGVGDRPFVVINPGGNNPAKRWPADRFTDLARWLESDRGLAVVVTGSPAEGGLAASIVAGAGLPTERALPGLGLTLGAVKRVLDRADLLVTNDTGPRHITAAFGTPVVTLFGPTDPRWTTIPFDAERHVTAGHDLPSHLVADDHPDRCRIDRIDPGSVRAAIGALLDERRGAARFTSGSSVS